MFVRMLAVLLAFALLGACGGEETADPIAESTSTSSPTASSEPADDREKSRPAKPRKQGTTVVARSTDFGTILFDEGGQAIYLFDVETSPEPRCYGACEEAWPPVLTEGSPRAGRQIEQSLLGTTERRGGDVQVTYGGHPLYFYAHEGKLEVKCHDVFLNGGTWYAVQPNGERAP
jgi:predicted lipoprotein with Yx(FWY)xxD motif